MKDFNLRVPLKLAITLMLVMMLIASAHYVWYRWERETLSNSTLRIENSRLKMLWDLDIKYYEAELAEKDEELSQYRPPQIPRPEVK